MHDINGAVPLNYQPDLLDPLGRTIMISFRKLFLPDPSWFRRQFQEMRQIALRRISLVANLCFSAATMTPVQPVRGTQSLLGEEADRLATVIAAFDRVRRLYGFKSIEVPTIEQTAVFARTIRETTDVVSKEMYSFEDRGGKSITLRPEFRRGCAIPISAKVGSNMRRSRSGPMGPPSATSGRKRAASASSISSMRKSSAPARQADVELLCLADQLLKELDIDGAILQLNTLGDPETRSAWRDALYEHFRGNWTTMREEAVAAERNACGSSTVRRIRTGRLSTALR